MRMDAKDILDAVELRYAADAIIYEMLGPEKCAMIARESRWTQGKDLISLLNNSEIEECKMREALGRHNLIPVDQDKVKSKPEKLPNIKQKDRVKSAREKTRQFAKSAHDTFKRVVRSGKDKTKTPNVKSDTKEVCKEEKRAEAETESKERFINCSKLGNKSAKDVKIAENGKYTGNDMLEQEKSGTNVSQQELEKLPKANKSNWFNKLSRKKSKTLIKSQDTKQLEIDPQSTSSHQEKQKLLKGKEKGVVKISKSKLIESDAIKTEKSNTANRIDVQDSLVNLLKIADYLPKTGFEQKVARKQLELQNSSREIERRMKNKSKLFRKSANEPTKPECNSPKENIKSTVDQQGEVVKTGSEILSEELVTDLVNTAVKVSGEKNIELSVNDDLHFIV